MDGRRRLAEPVTGSAYALWAAALRSTWQHVSWTVCRSRPARLLRRLIKLLERWPLPRGVGVATAVAFVLASVVYGTVRGGHLPEIIEQASDIRDRLANAAGFRISSIALAGEEHLSREEVLASAGITQRTSLLFLDAAEVRARLKSNPWIAEATVLKLYPGRLRIGITERQAFALWQKDGQVSLIAADGTVLEPYQSSYTTLPLVVGAGARTRAKDFLDRLGGYPQLREQLRAAVFIAERRWNLILTNGIEVRLPQDHPEQALDLLLRLDRDDKLMSRDITAIDLRLPDRVTVRLSDEAAAARAEAMKDKKPKKKGGAA